MGFGVQFDCNDQVLLSIGGGVGAGYSGTMTNTTGGSGGGGGMQVTLNGQVRPRLPHPPQAASTKLTQAQHTTVNLHHRWRWRWWCADDHWQQLYPQLGHHR